LQQGNLQLAQRLLEETVEDQDREPATGFHDDLTSALGSLMQHATEIATGRPPSEDRSFYALTVQAWASHCLQDSDQAEDLLDLGLKAIRDRHLAHKDPLFEAIDPLQQASLRIPYARALAEQGFLEEAKKQLTACEEALTGQGEAAPAIQQLKLAWQQLGLMP
jgi:hypothetical protein